MPDTSTAKSDWLNLDQSEPLKEKRKKVDYLIHEYAYANYFLAIANAYMAAEIEASRLAMEEYAKDSYLFGTAKE